MIAVAVPLVNIPYYALTPGPTQDVGELIRIREAATVPIRGELLLTTVSLRPIKIMDAMRGWFDPSIVVLSRSTIIPPGSSEQEVDRRTSAQMQESHVLAAAAALRLLGHDVKVEPTGARVRAVGDGVPAAASLRRGDVVIGADGRAVREAEDLVAAIQRHKVGDAIVLRVRRGEDTLDLTTRTVGRPENPVEPIIGVEIETLPDIRLPLAVHIETTGIGGPSGGLMFALGIYDLLDDADVTRGRTIAGTGEIRITGEVGAVGGIRQKVESARRAGAELFLVPTAELGQACGVARGLPVIGVNDLRQAVEALSSTRYTSARSCP